MILQMATLADSANDYNGKLCVLGCFDAIYTHDFPCVHPHCTLVLRFLFQHHDHGKQALTIEFKDPTGNDLLPPFNPELDIRFSRKDIIQQPKNLVLNLHQIEFKMPGVHEWRVSLNGQLIGVIPLVLYKVENQRVHVGPAG
jgi:hypothetical protein